MSQCCGSHCPQISYLDLLSLQGSDHQLSNLSIAIDAEDDGPACCFSGTRLLTRLALLATSTKVAKQPKRTA